MSTAKTKPNFEKTGRSRLLWRLLPLLLALCLALALLPAPEARAEYYDDAIQKLMGWGVLRGYPDGSLNPDSDITRAEFVALINRAYGYDESGYIPFSDVTADAWYHDDIVAAYAAGYFQGTSATTASPNGQLTREQAMVLLARNMRLDETGGEVTSFSDGRSFQYYSAGYANTAVEKGLVSGYTDGSFRPQSSITRGEMAVMLARALGSLVNDSGDYSLGDVYGNVTINSPGVTLRDTTIAGDLYLTGGLGLGGATLENVRVLGDIIVAGGGESVTGESVILRNVTADSVKVDTIRDEYVSLRAEGDTNVANARLLSDTYLQDRTASGLGFKNIALEDMGGTYTLSGNLENVTALGQYSTLRLSQGTVQNLTMDENATGASLWLDANATVRNLNLDTGAAVTGRGDVGQLNVNVPGTSTEMMPDSITIRPGVTSIISGTNMDTATAAEVSSDPKLLAGYPKMTNIAATSGTANFSVNKPGTVYWAVTAIMDGSVNADALRSPAARASILKSGSVNAAASNTVYTAAVSGLTSGGSYYLSAMLVDSRGVQSPVKVISFSTPDDSVPAFGSGYPYMIAPVKASEDAWAAVMPTKDCQLYWVLYDAGSAAPTANSFRTGAFAGAYGSGVRDVQKNLSDTLQVNTRALDEQKSYDLYLWLNDADNAKSSAVRKLTFSTVDETPPKFNDAQVTSKTKDTLKVTFNLNEAGTVYWVAVPASTAALYPSGNPATDADGNYYGTDLATKIKIANGSGATAGSGSVTAKADTDATATVSRLAEATRYTVFFVARDAAGNYSDNWYSLTDSTVDSTAPTVRGVYFSNQMTASRPYSDTDIEIVFSERVRQYYYDYGTEVSEDLLELYTDVRNAESEADRTKAKDELAKALRDTIHMYYKPNAGRDIRVAERTSDGQTNWTIDYRNATIRENEDGTMSVVFSTTGGALNLLSGARYYFEIQHIADIYDPPNRMSTVRPEPDPFETVDAEVYLSAPARTVSKLYRDADTPYEYEASSGLTGALDADVVFNVLPSSITKADPSQTWDMLIWSDGFLTFDLYVRVMDGSDKLVKLGTDAEGNFNGSIEKKKITNADGTVTWQLLTDGDSRVGTTEVGWLKCPGEAVIDLTSEETGIAYKGAFYQRDLLGKLDNPSIVNDDADAFLVDEAEQTYQFFGLEDGLTYQFAVHVTTISPGRNANRTTWTTDLGFWVTVDTAAPFYPFSELHGTDTVTDVAYIHMRDYETQSDGTPKIKEISTPEGFTMSVPFRDTVAPYFDGGYPRIEAAAETIDLTVRLNREGTVFWVIAPAGTAADAAAPISPSIATTRKYISVPRDANKNPLQVYQAGTNVYYDDDDVPQSGNGLYTRASSVDFYTDYTDETTNTPVERGGYTENWFPTYVAQPSLSNIYNPRYNNDRIFSGSFTSEASETLATIPSAANPTTGKRLEPDTNYFLYLVVRGSSAVYSESVQVFQFHTTSISAPVLSLSISDHYIVTVGANIASTADYALVYFDYDRMPALLSAKFNSAAVIVNDGVDTDGKPTGDQVDAYKRDMARLQIASRVDDLTVLEAMSYTATGGGSLFDAYAQPAYKTRVAAQVRGAVPQTQGIWTTEKDVSLDQTNHLTDTVNCVTDYDIPYITTFAFVAVAHDAAADDAEGDALAFRSIFTIYQLDASQPKVADVTYNLYGTYDSSVPGGYAINGSIVVTFDQYLYVYNSADTTGYPRKIVDGRPASESHPDSSISVQTLRGSSSSPGITIVADTSASSGEAVNSITLDVGENRTGYKVGDTGFIDLNGWRYKLSSQYSDPVNSSLILTLVLDTANLTGTVTVAPESVWTTSDTFIHGTFLLENPTAPNISLDTDTLRIIKDDKTSSGRTLTATVTAPASALVGDVEWTIANSGGLEVLRFDDGTTEGTAGPVYGESVKLLGRNFGKATVTARVSIGGRYYSTDATVYVTADTVSITGDSTITYSGTTLSKYYSATIDPDTTGGDLYWTIAYGDSTISISSDEKNKAVYLNITGAGTATLRVYAGPTEDEHYEHADLTISVTAS